MRSCLRTVKHRAACALGLGLLVLGPVSLNPVMAQTRFPGLPAPGGWAGGGRNAAEGPYAGRPAARVASVADVAPQAATARVRASLDAIYRDAAQANSVQLLDRCIQQCQSIDPNSLDQEARVYLPQLEAWLLNRRGEAYALEAGRLMEADDSRQSVSMEERAIEDYSASISIREGWRAFHNRGVSMAMLGRYDEAIASFGEAIRLNPNYTNTRFNRAELWLELGKYEEAEQEYGGVLQLDPSDLGARMGRGHARFYRGQFEAALGDFDDVIKAEPSNAVAFADRADLHAYLGHWELAAQDYRRAIQLDKSLGRAYQSAAWLMATCPDDRFRDPQLALRSAERAIQIDGTDDYRYLDTLAAAQANAQQFNEALSSLGQAIQKAPADAAQELRSRQALYQASRPFRDRAR